MTAGQWREIACVEDPLEVAGVRSAKPEDPTAVFPFPAIRDPRWNGALDSLAGALDLTVRSEFRPGLSGNVHARTALDTDDSDSRSAAVHFVYRGVEFERVRQIAYSYCLLRGRDVRTVGAPEELGDWLRRRGASKPLSIVLWGLASDFAFSLVEAFERTIHTSCLPPGCPCLGYMVAEDARQLLWLAFKTLLFWRVPPMSWPDGLTAKGDDDAFQFLPDRPGKTRRVASGDLTALRDTFDYLGLALHGRGYDAQFSRRFDRPSTICTQRVGQIPGSGAPGTAPVLGPRCSIENVCFRGEEFPTHEKVPVWELRTRVLFVNSCASWRIGDSDANYSAALAFRALDGFCTGYIGSRYEKPDDPRDDYRVLGAWKAGLPVGAAVRFASSAAAGADSPLHLFSLLGDPEQTRLQGADPGHDTARWDGAGGLHVGGAREATVAVAARGRGGGRGGPYRVAGTGQWAVWLGDPAVAGYRSVSLYLLELPAGPDGSDLTLVPDLTGGASGAAAEFDATAGGDAAAQGRWMTAKLLEVPVGARGYEDLARGTWRAYGRQYWPGPVAQYGDPHSGPQWGQSAYALEGECPGCGLATMRTATPVAACAPDGRGGTVATGHEVVDVFCPRCYQIGFFPAAPARLDMPGMEVVGAADGRIGRHEELVVQVRFPDTAAEGAVWIAVAPSERHVEALPPLPEPQPLWSDRRRETFRLRAACLLPGIHHVRAYFCRASDYALSAAGRMIHVV